MKPILRIFVIGLIFGLTSIAWLILGAVMNDRSNEQRYKLQESVSELWGQPQSQRAPALEFHWMTSREVEREETVGKQVRKIRETVIDHHHDRVEVDSTKLDVSLSLDQRLKGLMWYSLYDVGFEGRWTYVHERDEAGELRVAFTFPDANGLYDDFHFVLDGKPLELTPANGVVHASIPVKKGDQIDLNIGYLSRGMDSWTYVPSEGVASLKNFDVAMKTDFTEIDFPGYTMSPSSKTPIDGGWALDWSFKQVITGYKIGMVMPTKIQPGELASSLSFSAPISLLFFFLMIWVLSTLRKIDIHPINYFFLGGAFFAFHLLFSYSVDHLTVLPAFILASAVSILLVVTYLRLVVSNRFAFVEATLAQIVYLIGFSMAHFWDGFTGLTVTCLSILTLFILMQLTGRIQWSEVLTLRRTEEGRVSPS
jgi:inner membrane protein involved in colicin E2 resistance